MEVSYLISKAEAAYQHCRRLCEDGRLYREEATYLGSKLALVLATVHQWRRLVSSSSTAKIDEASENDSVLDGSGASTTSAVFDHFHEALEEVYLCMEAAVTTSISDASGDRNYNDDIEVGGGIREDRTKWRDKVRNFLEGTELLVAIQRAKDKLDAALNIFNINQSNVILEEIHELRDSLTNALEQFGRQQIRASANDRTNSVRQTVQEKVDQVLDEYNRNEMEITLDNEPESTQSSHSGSTAGGDRDRDSRTNTTLTYRPEPHEIEALALDDEVVCSFKSRNYLGGGSFSEVYSGLYKGRKVAIKRLNVGKREFKRLNLSQAQLRRDEERVLAEATLMAKCGHSNIVEVIGCRAVYTRIERPIIVMQVRGNNFHFVRSQFSHTVALTFCCVLFSTSQLMHTTLYHVLHDASSAPYVPDLTYVRRLKLLRDIASAVEFLHLQVRYTCSIRFFLFICT